MHRYRIKTNETKIYIQKQFFLWDIPLWWYTVDESGYSIGEWNFIKYYDSTIDAKNAIKIFCEEDAKQDLWNKPCDVAYETDCKKELKND